MTPSSKPTEMKFMTVEQIKWFRELKQRRYAYGKDWEPAVNIIESQNKCIDLMLYYVNGDATWEGLKVQLEEIMKGGAKCTES